MRIFSVNFGVRINLNVNVNLSLPTSQFGVNRSPLIASSTTLTRLDEREEREK
jgi:hypothetical protein